MTIPLQNLRESISDIDREILTLLSKRMDLAKEVARYKKENNLPIFDPKREEEILLNYQERVNFQIGDIYRAIIDESKRIQREFLSPSE